MKFTAILALIFVTFLSSAEGLAFVTFILRPSVNQMTAFKTIRSTPSTAPISLSNAANKEGEEAIKINLDAAPVFGSDESTRAHRSEMLDLVYQRQMDRLNSFSQ